MKHILHFVFLELKNAQQLYHSHKYNVKNRDRKDQTGGVIEFRLTFEHWLEIWVVSGHWERRGRGAGKYCMARLNDLGHYEVGNVFIQSFSDNSKEAHFGKKRFSTSKCKPCTVDGITVYPSCKSLIAALGRGKNGYSHSEFRYVPLMKGQP